METSKHAQFSTLLIKHKGIVYSVLNEYRIHEPHKDDLFQEVSARAWEAFDSFEWKSKFSTWLHNVARNTVIDFLRRLNKFKFIVTHNILWDIADKEYEEIEPGISMSVIDRLTDTEKRTLAFRMEGLTFSKISERTGEPVSRLLIRMHRIKKLLEDGVKNKYIPISQRKKTKK